MLTYQFISQPNLNYFPKVLKAEEIQFFEDFRNKGKTLYSLDLHSFFIFFN